MQTPFTLCLGISWEEPKAHSTSINHRCEFVQNIMFLDYALKGTYDNK